MDKTTFFECVKGTNESVQNLSKPTLYYLSYYDDLRNKKGILKWNTAAFLFSAYWLLYRKMYVDFIHYIAFIYVSTSFYSLGIQKLKSIGIHNDTIQNISTVVLLLLRLLPAIFYGLMGNYLYFINVKDRFKKRKSQGTNIITPLIFLVIVLFIMQKSIKNY